MRLGVEQEFYRALSRALTLKDPLSWLPQAHRVHPRSSHQCGSKTRDQPRGLRTLCPSWCLSLPTLYPVARCTPVYLISAERHRSLTRPVLRTAVLVCSDLKGGETQHIVNLTMPSHAQGSAQRLPASASPLLSATDPPLNSDDVSPLDPLRRAIQRPLGTPGTTSATVSPVAVTSTPASATLRGPSQTLSYGGSSTSVHGERRGSQIA